MQWLNATFPSKQGFTFLRIYLIIKLRAKTCGADATHYHAVEVSPHAQA